MKVFVPFSDELMTRSDINRLGDLVPFQLDYRCLGNGSHPARQARPPRPPASGADPGRGDGRQS